MARIRLTLVLFVLCGCIAVLPGCGSGGNGDVPPEAEGEAIQIDASTGKLQINRAIVSQGDVRAANGGLHRLDGVLLETTRGWNASR